MTLAIKRDKPAKVDPTSDFAGKEIIKITLSSPFQTHHSYEVTYVSSQMSDHVYKKAYTQSLPPFH